MIIDLENELFAEWKKRNKNFSADGVVNESLYNTSCKKQAGCLFSQFLTNQR
jgi:hypothetical protein